MNSKVTFGDWLRRRRRALDLTQAELAEQVACSVVTIRKLEANKRCPSKQLAGHLADGLNIAAGEHSAFIAFARTEPDLEQSFPPPQSFETPPWRTPHRRAVNLPSPLTPLLGRGQEVAALRNRMLDGATRLLTLVGAPGIGKTRLSVQVAADLLDAFDDGVCFVELAPLRNEGLVAGAIAQTLGIKESGSRSLITRLTDHLGDKHMLLILDNFEHVLAAAPLVADMLEACPGLKVLATSRAPLEVRGEQQFPVPPLLLPDLRRLPAIDELARCSSVALFVTRAQAVDPDFALTEANAPAVAAICARLDGLPLAIELAAARSKLLPPQQLLDRLSSRLELLTEGPQDLPRRQRTLRGAIRWSFELLDDWEQTLLTRLAAFVGGWTLEAAETITAGSNAAASTGPEQPPTPRGQNVLDGLASLVNESLVQRQEQAGGQVRFTMLETIREYALERLDACGEGDTMRREHATYYLALAKSAEPELRGPRQRIWLRRLEREHDNLRAGLQWTFDRQETEMALRLCGALWRFWELRGYLSEGRQWLEDTLAQSEALLKRARPRPSHILARAEALSAAGMLAQTQGDIDVAHRLYEESMELSRQQGDERSLAYTFHNLGTLAQCQGEHALAAEHHTACLKLSRKLGERVGIYISLYNLAEVALAQGEYEQAENLHEESLALKREHGDTWSIAWSLFCLAKLARIMGNHERAAQLHEESLRLRWQLEDRLGIAESLAGVAGVAITRRQPERAVRLLGAMEALLDRLSATLSPHARDLHERTLAETDAQLDKATFTSWWAEGQAMSLEQAIAYALGDDARPNDSTNYGDG